MVVFEAFAGPLRVGLVGVALLAAGCASQQVKVDRFAAFAAAGTAFTQAMDPVFDESFAATANSNALVLMQAREALPPNERLSALEQADGDLSQRLAILRDLKRHAGLLQSYFDALASLSASTAESSGTVAVAQGLVAALGKLSPSIANASVAGTPIANLVAPAAQFVFVAHQSRVLDAELRRHAATIDSEIRLQQAALSALADAYAADLDVARTRTYRDQVELPFARPGTLPPDWGGTRARLLQGRLDTTTVQAAATAAERLRAGFVALVENRLTGASVAALRDDVDAILAAVEKVRAARATTASGEGSTP